MQIYVIYYILLDSPSLSQYINMADEDIVPQSHEFKPALELLYN